MSKIAFIFSIFIFQSTLGNTLPRNPHLPLDPYRWMEDAYSSELTDWRSNQVDLTSKYLDSVLEPAVRESVDLLFREAYEKESDIKTSNLDNGYQIRLINQGIENPNKIALFQNGNLVRDILVQPEDKPQQNFTTYFLSPNKLWMVVPIVENGSRDYADLHLIRVSDGEVLKVINTTSPRAVTWMSSDSFGYYQYSRNEGLFLVHDILGSKTELPSSKGFPRNTRDGNWVYNYKEEKLIVRHISTQNWQEVPHNLENIYHITDKVMVGTHRTEENEVVLSFVDVNILPGNQLEFGGQRLINENKNRVLGSVYNSNGKILVKYSWGKDFWLRIFNENGKDEHLLDWPGELGIRDVEFHEDKNVYEFKLSSAINKEMVFAWEPTAGAPNFKDWLAKMHLDSYGNVYLTKWIDYQSKDGTSVPMRILYKQGTSFDGENPLMVEGYGGFNLQGYLQPYYRFATKLFVSMGGIYAAPALRGGNELGSQWHEGGNKLNKQNTFDDMIAAIEYLHDKKYSKPDRTAIQGYSNGGLLVGAVMTQRPDLLGLAIPGVGVLDMIRRDILDYDYGQGWSWEYGYLHDTNIVDLILDYSPYINALKTNKYPTTVVVSGDSDTRVNPVHSYKFTAALQSSQLATNPILLLSVENAGHGPLSEPSLGKRGFNALTSLWKVVYQKTGVEVAQHHDWTNTNVLFGESRSAIISNDFFEVGDERHFEVKGRGPFDQ